MTKRVTQVAPADAARVIGLVCQEIDNARDLITSEASWDLLEQYFYEALLGQHTLDAAVVLGWADAGHPAADRAVRRYGAEVLDAHREGELLAQVRGHIIKILLRPFVPFPKGRHVVQTLMRDVWIPTVIASVAAGTGLDPTRSGATPTPAAAYFVALAMKRRGFKITEREVNRIYWNRSKIAARLEDSMPQIPSTIK
jgi:hypothetical protein